jgi:acyl carrier protein
VQTHGAAGAVLPPIGKPIANTQIYILDRWRQPVPRGVPGEIYIGGANLARGYLNHPQLTAERFVANPFAHDESARLYRTGDLGRWTAQGEIEYLGRNDDQIKIRGYRIEPGEIEAHLTRHAHVRQAAVIAREDLHGQKRLVAYLTLLEPRGTSEDFRAYLAATLPEYMVPSAFVIMEQLPLTPSGKLDRRSLPLPGTPIGPSQDPPQTDTETALAALWSELLGVQDLGRNHNFFEAGGHSLHGMRLVVKIEEHFGVNLAVTAIFQYPTIAEMAAIIDELSAAQSLDEALDTLDYEQGVIIASDAEAASLPSRSAHQC